MSTEDSLTPLQVADLLVPRFLGGETMLRSEVESEYHLSRATAGSAIRHARDVLADDHNVVLPIANYGNDWLLAITDTAIDAFLGELPQLRALRTRQRNLMRRLTVTMALVRTRPRLMKAMWGTLSSATETYDHALETYEVYMEDEIEESHK